MAYYNCGVFEGGGVKGILYAGVALELQRMGVLKDLESVAGSSVGSIAALLFATGWSAEKITDTMKKLDFAKMLKGDLLDKIEIPITIEDHFGLYKADMLHDWLGEVIKEVTGDSEATFATWEKHREKNPAIKSIYVRATNANTRRVETFSHKENCNEKIKDAIRASSAFPGILTPVILKGQYFGDGGVQDNCPSEIFSGKDKEFNPYVLTMRVDDKDEILFFTKGILPKPKPINNVFQYLENILGAALSAQDAKFLGSEYTEHTIFGDTLGLQTFDLDLSEEKINAVIASGQYCTILYFLNNHPELVEAANYDPKLIQMIRDHEKLKSKNMVSDDVNSFQSFVEYLQDQSAQKKQLKLSNSEASSSEKRNKEGLHRPHKSLIPWKSLTFNFRQDPAANVPLVAEQHAQQESPKVEEADSSCYCNTM